MLPLPASVGSFDPGCLEGLFNPEGIGCGRRSCGLLVCPAFVVIQSSCEGTNRS